MQFQRARERVLESVVDLTDEQSSRPGADGWSIKDHLTHLTVWHEMRFFEISRIARGGQAAFPDAPDEHVDPLNNFFSANRRDLSLGQVIADLEFAWEMVAQAIASSPEDRMDQRLYEGIGIGGGADHDVAHAEMIAAFRS